MRRLLTLLAVVALCAGFAGCGGGGGSDGADTSGKPLTKAQYEQQFRAAVKGASRRTKAAKSGSLIQQLRRAQEKAKQLADDLAALTPPAEARKAHDDYVAGVQEVVTHLDRAITAFEQDGDVAKARGAISAIPEKVRSKFESSRRFFDANDYELGLSS